jgi:hypothetical protein
MPPPVLDYRPHSRRPRRLIRLLVVAAIVGLLLLIVHAFFAASAFSLHDYH